MRSQYTVLSLNAQTEEIKRWISDVTRARQADLDDYDLQESSKPKIFNAPASSTDTKGTEKVGDIAVDASYLYIVVDNSGTLEWRRVGISSF